MNNSTDVKAANEGASCVHVKRQGLRLYAMSVNRVQWKFSMSTMLKPISRAGLTCCRPGTKIE